MTQTATSRPLTLVANVPQKPRLQAFASIASPVRALQWSSSLYRRELRSGKRDSCSANKVSVCGGSKAKKNFCAHFLHEKEDGYFLDGAQQSVVSSCLQEPRREGRIWWHGSQQQNEKKTQQLGIWRTKAERRDSLGVEADWEREEARWLREEQRWLREEDRWRREEARWTEERKAWVQESLAMAEEIKPPIIENKHVLHTSSMTISSSETDTISEEEIFLAPHSTPSMSDFSIDLVASRGITAGIESRTSGSGSGLGAKSTQSPTRQLLKRGAEGAEVKALQEALAKLGYYLGEDETQHSSFSKGTEAAVKAWQVSVGEVDDGIMSAQLLAQLSTGEKPADVSDTKKPNAASSGQVSSAKQPAASLKMTPKHRETEMDRFSTIDDSTGHGSRPRVYLLGENRWEDSSRLIKKSKGQKTNLKPATEKCFSCRGEGVTLCTECEGTGDLNVEEQFLEWVEEGPKCPYCEGTGSVPCDVCLGMSVCMPNGCELCAQIP
ncbi:unnamed protein product [Sphagnum troendelagicum]|uniref:Peptidoglycan binding-like domain-containing protein n=1 Tax=Sphagnum troendelagicum TaxID=128251 RepID=A0ABP0U167_9BRYO